MRFYRSILYVFDTRNESTNVIMAIIVFGLTAMEGILRKLL